MSLAYEMKIDITGAKSDKIQAIAVAVGELWEFPEDQPDTFDCHRDKAVCDLEFCGDGRLCGGTAEDEMADEIRDAVWLANGGYCQVLVRMTYLEDLPYEEYLYTDMEYEDWAEARRRMPVVRKTA